MSFLLTWIWSAVEFVLGGAGNGLRFLVRGTSVADETGDGDGHGDGHGVSIVVRTNTGRSVPVTLMREWTVAQVKEEIAKAAASDGDGGGATPTLRIILAGRELGDDVKISDCDIGQQSVLHAIQILEPRGVDVASSARPLNESLLDLQLTSGQKAAGTGSDCTSQRKSRAHFFVYCSVCATMPPSPGKLRVRCSKCLQGAVVVDRDPASWEDVLTPGRVTGTCAGSDCVDGPRTSVEFYFKCASGSHPSESEDAPPLYLVRTNLFDLPCLACADVAETVVVFECGGGDNGGHVVCLSCFRDYCVSRLNERAFVLDDQLGYTLGCPEGCDSSRVREGKHFRLLDKEQYDRYQRFAAEEYVLRSGGVFCPQPGCGMGIMPGEGQECRRVVCGGNDVTNAPLQDDIAIAEAAGLPGAHRGGGRTTTAAGCGYVFCRDCLQGYHIGECVPTAAALSPQPDRSSAPRPFRAAAAASLARWDSADPSAVAIRLLTKPCPQCRTATERDGGCMHMVCTKPACGFHWCWVCQTEWTRECMANHWFG